MTILESVDVRALVRSIEAHARRSRELKRRLRQTWTEPMAEVQVSLVRCRRRTTELLILRAWLRGKCHLLKPLRDGAYPGMKWERERYHRLVAERTAGDFTVAVAS